MWENRRKGVFEVVPPDSPLVVFYEARFFQTWHVFIKHDVLLPLYSYNQKIERARNSEQRRPQKVLDMADTDPSYCSGR